MIFLAATGKIDPRKINLNDDHALFVLQDGSNEYQVKTMGLEQYNTVKKYRPGQSMFILGKGTHNNRP